MEAFAMRCVPSLIAMLTVVMTVGNAAAQPAETRPFEIGASLGSACLVESSACGGGRHAMNGLYGSVWLTPRIEIGGRVAMLRQPNLVGGADYFLGPTQEPIPLRFVIRDQSRVYVLGHAYRHFGRDAKIRFFLGIAAGSYIARSTVTCETDECERNLARLGGPSGVGVEFGRQNRARANLAFGVGVSGHSGPVGWRAGVNLHNFPGENTGATELFPGGAVRF
jgi:hypothetical protein